MQLGSLVGLVLIMLLLVVLAIVTQTGRNVIHKGPTGPRGTQLDQAGPMGTTGPSADVLATGPTGTFAMYEPLAVVASNQSEQDGPWTSNNPHFIRFSSTGSSVPAAYELVTFGMSGATGDFIRVLDAGVYQVSYHLNVNPTTDGPELLSYLVRNSNDPTFASNPDVLPWTFVVQRLILAAHGFKSIDMTTTVQLEAGDELRWSLFQTLTNLSFVLVDSPYPDIYQNNSRLIIQRSN